MEVPRLLGREERANGSDARVLAFDGLPVRCGSQLPHALAPEGRRRSLRDQLQSAWELDDVERVGIHDWRYTGMAKPELAKVVASSGFMIPGNVVLTPAY